MATVHEEAKRSLERVQNFDPQQLARSDLGAAHFNQVVEPAKRVIALFQLIPSSVLDDLPQQNAQAIQQQADSLYSILKSVLDFNIENGNLSAVRSSTVQQLTEGYNGYWNALHPYIGFAAGRTADFQRLEREGRAAVQSIADRTDELLAELNKTKEQADEALAAARRAASEQGVSQQAIYFRDEADKHEKDATFWRIRTQWAAGALAAYAMFSLWFHKIGWLKPIDALDAAQLVTSKVLVFAVISYLLLLSAKNYLSNRHNAIVNRHRQNALMTFSALAVAAHNEAAKDIILTHAAACIFAPQETGYAKSSSGGESSLAQAAAGLLAKSDRPAS